MEGRRKGERGKGRGEREEREEEGGPRNKVVHDVHGIIFPSLICCTYTSLIQEPCTKNNCIWRTYTTYQDLSASHDICRAGTVSQVQGWYCLFLNVPFTLVNRHSECSADFSVSIWSLSVPRDSSEDNGLHSSPVSPSLLCHSTTAQESSVLQWLGTPEAMLLFRAHPHVEVSVSTSWIFQSRVSIL